MLRTALVLLFALGLPRAVPAAPPLPRAARHWPLASPVVALAQTPDGHLWLGTKTGLCRMDGVATVCFDDTNTPAFPGDRVTSLLVLRDRRLLVGTERGIVVSDGAAGFSRVGLPAKAGVG